MNRLQPSQPELTIEDLATFRRCNKESFWYRCVPMVIGASLAVTFARSRGFFLNRPRLLLPTYFLAGVIGYVGGKISYIDRCKRLFLELEDSRVKDVIANQSTFLPRVPGFSNQNEWQKPGDDALIVETPTTYAERREYYRKNQTRDVRPEVPSSKFPNVKGDDEVLQKQPEKQTPSSPSPSDYFDSERPLSSYLSDDEYRPME